METKIVLWEKKEGIGLVTLNRPEQFNAFNRELILDLAKLLEEAREDDEVKVVVITGAGKAFCAGGDLKGHPSFTTDDPIFREVLAGEGGLITRPIYKMPKPVIAAVNGPAVGAGIELALNCDIQIASDRARFSEIFVSVGIMPDMGGTWLLPRIVGLGRALEMIFTGDIIDADHALKIGLVNHVVPHEELMKKTMEMAGRFAKGPSQSYKRCKWAVYRAMNLDLDAALEHEAISQGLLLGTQDVRNAAKAFAEKKKPVFKGR